MKMLSAFLALVMALALVACQSGNDGSDGAGKDGGNESGKKILRFLSNIQDREHTEGLIEQMQLDKWLEKNPDFEFDYEFVPNANIGEKTAQYMATDNLPDVYKEWGGSLDFKKRAKEKMIVPIWDSPEQANEEGYDYPEGALAKWQVDTGTGVYAGVVNFDFFIWFYNGEMFEQEGWSEPTTWQELLDLIDAIKASGRVPMSMSSKGTGQTSQIVNDLLMRVTGDPEIARHIIEQTDGRTNWTGDEEIRTAFEYAHELVEHDLAGGTSWLAQDYAGARGLFVNGEVPLLYFGSWEYMMIADDQLPQSFRDNLDFFLTPAVPGGKGDTTLLSGYYGCGFAVASKCKYLEDAIGLIKFYFQKENYCKDAWELKVFVPAQNFSEFSSDKDARLQKKIVEVMESRTGNQVTSAIAGYSTTWQSLVEPLYADFWSGNLEIDALLAELDVHSETTREDARNMGEL